MAIVCLGCGKGLFGLDAHEGRVRLLQAGRSIREAKALGPYCWRCSGELLVATRRAKPAKPGDGVTKPAAKPADALSEPVASATVERGAAS